MTRYTAFLRGVSPVNASMPALKRAFEAGGFGEVQTLLSSGNVLFSARTAKAESLSRKVEAMMQEQLGRTFMTFVRPVESLRASIAADPYRAFRVTAEEKRIVTMLRTPPLAAPRLPIGLDTARILAVVGLEVFSVYRPSDNGPVFMRLIEKTFGKDVTTRTWDTVRKCAR